MSTASSFFKKTIESTKIIRYLIEKFLLPAGYFTLSDLLQDNKASVGSEQIRGALSYLIKENFVRPEVCYSPEYDINITFFMTQDLFKDLESDPYLKNTAQIQKLYRYSKIEKRETETRRSTANALYDIFKANGFDAALLDKVPLDDLDFIFSAKPFPNFPGLDCNLETLVKDFSIEFGPKEIESLLMEKKGELAALKKNRQVQETLDEFLNEIKYAKLPQVITHVQAANSFSEQIIKQVINASRESIVTCVIETIKVYNYVEFGSYRAHRVNEKIEVVCGNTPFPYEKALQDDSLSSKLLQKMFQRRLVLKYNLNLLRITGDYEKELYVVKKSKIASIIQDIVSNPGFITSKSDLSTLLLFHTIMNDFKARSALHMISGSRQSEKNSSLGYPSIDELEKATAHVGAILDLKFRRDLLTERIGDYEKRENEGGLLYKIFAFFFLRKKKAALIKSMQKTAETIAMYKTYLSPRAVQRRAHMG